MRKFLALVLALVMTMSLVTISAGAATTFTDDAQITNSEAVEVLNAMGVMGGYADGSFRPQATLTRGAGAKLIAYLMLGQAKADKLQATYTVFEDVTDAVGLAPYIEWAAANNIVGGYGNGNFGPYDTLTQYAFGKMLLGALRYDAAEEGYAKAGWQKNVYADAVNTGIFDGTENYGACTREKAAAMTLGALQADIVVYGSGLGAGTITLPNGSVIAAAPWVDGCYETGVALWEEYAGLGYVEGLDVFGRPGHKWTYKAAFEKFYMDAPVAEYTTAVTDCQILADFGVSKASPKSINIVKFDNGAMAKWNHDGDDGTTPEVYGVSGIPHSHAACTGKVGGQGVLTQLFKVGTNYIVTEIDTYLAKVEAVANVNHTVAAKTKLDVFVGNSTVGTTDAIADNTTATNMTGNTDFGCAKGDYVLVNASKIQNFLDESQTPDFLQTLTAAGLVDGTVTTDYAKMALDAYNYAFESEDGDSDNDADDVGKHTYVSVVGAPSVIAGGKFTGFAFDKSLVTVNGVETLTSNNYEASVIALDELAFGKTFDFLVDLNGNVIGDKLSGAIGTYGYIDAMRWHYTGGLTGNAAVALVNAAAENNEIVMSMYDSKYVIDGDSAADPADTYPLVAQTKAVNAAEYNDFGVNYGVVIAHALADGSYNLVAAADETNVYAVTTVSADGAIAVNNPTLTGVNGDTDGDGDIDGADDPAGDAKTIITDSETVFLVKTKTAAGANVYTSYTGYGSVPAMTGAKFVAIHEGDGTAAVSTTVGAAFVFVDATAATIAGTNTVAFVTNAALNYTEQGEYYRYQVYVGGELQTIKVSKTAKDNTDNAHTAGELFYTGGAATLGVFELVPDASGVVIEVNLLQKAAVGGFTSAATTAWGTNVIAAVNPGSITMTTGGAALAVNETTKIYVVNYNDADHSGAWDNAEVLLSVEGGDTSDLAAAQIVYKVNAVYNTLVDTIFVFNPVI